MSENNHTPGPWVVEPGQQGGFCISDKANGWALCARPEWPNRAKMSIANAELIASAPETKAQRDELLAASMAMDEARDEYDHAYHPEDRMRALNKERDALAKLRAAIRRAQGGGDE